MNLREPFPDLLEDNWLSRRLLSEFPVMKGSNLQTAQVCLGRQSEETKNEESENGEAFAPPDQKA